MDSLMNDHMKLQSLALFRGLLCDPVVQSLDALLRCPTQDTAEQVARYGDFAARLFAQGGNLTDFLLARVLEDENIYMLSRARRCAVDDTMERCVDEELAVLQTIAALTPETVRAHIAYEGYLPVWNNRNTDFTAVYHERIAQIGAYGYGMFAKYHTFIIKSGVLTPVQSPDATRLSQLSGYERERQQVIDNTLALLKGKPAANVLLRGDAGTGKSSTVKAVANEYKDRGLRLIEVTKKQLHEIPELMDSLSLNPLKFILFIDDLSFAQDDDDFGALKAILEGSVSAKSGNLVIYATSNRRHLVKEQFSDREGDDIHRNDTIQEQISLSERFGLRVNFYKPDKALYLNIVRDLAAQYGVQLAGEELDAAAERYALARSGRSPRIARQFIESVKAQEDE